jgi:hypothetical protein
VAKEQFDSSVKARERINEFLWSRADIPTVFVQAIVRGWVEAIAGDDFS